ncbi:MAG: LegC family aminotransferase [Chloroflexota bacterium]
MMKPSFEPGAPMQGDGIPLCIPEIRGNEEAYIKQCLDTNFVSSVGPFVDRFEEELAAYTNTKFGIATSTGTAALHIALLVSGVQPDEEILVSTLTFVAPVNAIRYVGAWPVFVDAEPDYWQMDPQKVIDFAEKDCNWENGELRNKHTGRRVRAIMPVHILGHPVDMDPILEVAKKYNLIIIEDATESLGANYKGRKTGSIGDIACFSFNGNKIITTGGGGMIVTDNEAWARKAKYLTTQAKDDPIEFVHHEIGFNYRLTNIQAALGCAQLEQLDGYITAKRRIAETYTTRLKNIPGLIPMQQADWAFSIFWMYTILVDEAKFGMNSRDLMQKFIDKNIQVRPFWQPVHLSKAHTGSYFTDCSVAEKLNRDGLSLPCSVGLKDSEQERVIDFIQSIFS